MPQVELDTKPDSRKRSSMLVFVAAGVIVVALGGYLFWRLVPTAASVVEAADGLANSSGYSASYDKLKNAYARAIFKSDKELILPRLASAAAERNDDQAALQYYQDLNRLKPHDLPTLYAMGEIADKSGDKQVAVTAFNDAISTLQSGKQEAQTKTAIDDLSARVKELQK